MGEQIIAADGGRAPDTANAITQRHQDAAVGGKRGQRDNRDGENAAQIARSAQHHQPGHAAACQHHADAEHQTADDGAREALRGGEKAGFRDIDLVGEQAAIEPPG
jgi:hypothetical protein